MIPGDKPLIDSYLACSDTLLSVNDFVFLWTYEQPSEFAVCGGVLFARNVYEGVPVYFRPIRKGGQTAADTVELLKLIANAETACRYQVVGFSEEEAAVIPGVFHSADYDDYIYNTSDLIGLRGKAYHAKRNHIANFRAAYDCIFRDYRADDYDEIIDFTEQWCRDAILEHCFELNCLKNNLRAVDAIGARCGVIEIDGRIKAYSVVSVSPRNVGQVHFEKADRNIEGIYTAINQFCAEKYLSRTRFINRQEDLGLPGLRKAKQSYGPALMAKKYMLFIGRNTALRRNTEEIV